MADKKEYIDVDDTSLVEEVHDRIDVLITMLEKKGIMTREEFDSKYDEFMDKKFEQ